jgi:hypothetical protein
VEEYDPATDTWAKRADMWSSDSQSPVKRFGFASCTLNDQVYAIGGSLFTQAPYTTLSLTLGYTPPLFCSIRLTATNSIIVAWPASATAFELEQASNPHAPDWSNVAIPPVTVGEEKQVIVPLPVGRQFYRLNLP